MAKKNRLTSTAVRIGSTVGKADGAAHRTAHKITNAVHLAQQELADLTKQVEAFKRQLKKSTKKLKRALR